MPVLKEFLVTITKTHKVKARNTTEALITGTTWETNDVPADTRNISVEEVKK